MRGIEPRSAWDVRYPIGLLLAFLAAVPLAGAGWFAIDHTRDATVQRDQTATVDESVRDLIVVNELRTRLLDERNWYLAIRGIEDIGLDPSIAAALTGIDVLSELERSQAEVDALLVALDDAAVTAEVRNVRATEEMDLSTVGLRYGEVESELSATGDATLDDLLGRAGTLEDADRLVTSLRILRASTVARQAISNEFTAFFNAQFLSVQGISADLREAVEQRAIRAEAERDIRRLAIDGSNAHEAIGIISASPEANVFDEAVADFLEQQLGSEAGQGSNLASVLDDLDGVAATFLASSTATDLYFDLVDAAGADTLDAGSSLASRAEARQREAMMWMLALGSASLVVGLAATRAIRRPVRRLAGVAERISAGDSAARFDTTGGPIEIRAAGRALDEAAGHLQLAERQAKALADGDLEHPILSDHNTGALGASLQEAVGALATSMQQREEFRRRMTHEATHDGLTGIANRNASLAQLNRGLARTQRSGASLAVLFIDLDDFKAVNDNHGHRAGDTVLRTIAQRMVNQVRAGDHVGRLGGDEFVVIAEGVDGVDDAIELAERLLEALNEPIQCEGVMLEVGGSIGISMSDALVEAGAQSEDGIALLRDADLAVYKAKSEGRGRIALCDEELRTAMFERQDIEKALQRAIDEDEFVLHYQPIIKPPEGTLQGFEALIRWNRPAKGMLAPDDFIPFAERSDLIVTIDQWVVGAVARQIRAWDAEGKYAGLPVSINISGRHLSSPDFLDDVMSPLQDFGVDPSRIVIEITESALLDDLDGAAAKLQALRTQGIRTAIDDFGTGYTSLAHLKSLPIDILKIDRSFTIDESSASLVKLIIDTGHLLGATVTAEGIETEGQADSLTAMGSDELQGYLFGRPGPPHQMTDSESSAAADEDHAAPGGSGD